MAIAVRITPSKMSKDDYHRVMGELEETGATDGRLSHTSYGDDEVHIFDVWESREAFDPYHDRLMTILQGSGIDGGTVEVKPVQRTID
jgi:hypothetical protein